MTQPTPHPKLRIAVARNASALWVKNLLTWVESCQLADESKIKKELAIWVEEYVENPQVLPANNANITNNKIVNTLH